MTWRAIFALAVLMNGAGFGLLQLLRAYWPALPADGRGMLTAIVVIALAAFIANEAST